MAAQYIAKLYTEGLGQVPDQGGWAYLQNYVKANKCNGNSLDAIAIGVLSSPEAESLGYSPEERILTMYRSLLNRDPDGPGLAYWVGQIRLGASGAEVVTRITKSTEAKAYQLRACFGGSQGFNSGAAVATMTGQELQGAIDNLPTGGVLELPSGTVVTASQTIVVGIGKTVTTAGGPGPRRYAKQARIIRNGDFPGPLVSLKPGARLQSMWVDGQKSRWGHAQGRYNVRTEGGLGTAVVNSKISDTAGATGIEFRNAPDALEREVDRRCSRNEAIGNLITSYTSSQPARQWADGLSVHCEDVQVLNNSVVDATDVAIILFNYPRPYVNGTIEPQRSRVAGNVMLNAGNSAFAALAVDPFFTWERINNKPAVGDPIGSASRSFEGTAIENNLFWTSETAGYEIAMAIGTRPWFGVNSYTGRGGSYSGNSTGTLRARVDFGIVVSGMLDVKVKGNQLLLDASDFSLCPYTTEAQAGRAIASKRAGNVGLGIGFASGDIQDGGGYTIAPFTDCIGKRLKSE
jgi:hypothetical protein